MISSILEKDNMIINAGNAEFLGEIERFDDLPSGCLFNKIKTGCGGTSIALNNKKPYVIAMPYTELIKSKMYWCKERDIEAVPVYSESGATKEDIRRADKIMVTYDSLPIVMDVLGDRVKEFKILIDEYHLLTKSGDFRYKAINKVLSLYSKFGDFVFMSATPIKKRYLPDAIQDIPEVSVHWENITPVILNYTILERDDLYSTIAGIANKHFKKELFGNCYFFLNSVKSIIKIIQYLKKAGINSGDIRIICSDRLDNRHHLDEGIGKSFIIESVTDKPKKINFLTSKAFEGADILDEDGVSYIVSDGQKDHTKYDIMTTIPQIIGRIRNATYRNKVQVIFSPSEYFSFTTKAEFIEHVEQKLSEAKDYVKKYNQDTNPSVKEALLKMAESNSYLVINDNNEIEVKDTAKKAEMSNFDAIHITYYTKRTKEGKIVQREGSTNRLINNIPYTFTNIPGDKFTLNRLEAFEIGAAKINFKEMCAIYNEIVVIHNSLFGIRTEKNEEKLKRISSIYPLIPEAFKILGYNKIKALGYNQKNIKAEILRLSKIAEIVKIRELLNPRVYKVGRQISTGKIKSDLQKIYNKLKIDKRASATDLKQFFHVEKCKVPYNKYRLNGYRIIGPE